jgi:hypothetical protein
MIENNLDDAAAVAQVQKDEVAMVAAAVNPAHQHHLLTGVSGAQFTAQMCTLKIS